MPPRKIKGRETIGRPVWPNQGIQAKYRKRLQSEIKLMARSYEHWVGAAYKANEPRMAMDATPAVELDRVMRRLGKYWLKRFDKGARAMAEYFLKSVRNQSDAALKRILRDAGFSVQFKIEEKFQDVMQAAVIENVSLIRSIPQQFHTQVEGAVMRSVQTGRDLDGLVKELRKQQKVAFDRAKLIARDQNNKATAALQRARQTDLGLKEGIWMHSHAGKVPRRTHLENDQKRFNIQEGWFDPDPKVRRHIMPGELINCRCVWRPVIPGLT